MPSAKILPISNDICEQIDNIGKTTQVTLIYKQQDGTGLD